jgi:hypothetical protein
MNGGGAGTSPVSYSRLDAKRVKEAEKIGHNQAVKVLLEILVKKPRMPF